MADRRFEGKTVLVTGAASGIGRQTALAFAREGAELVICDVDESRLEETAAAVRGLGRSVSARRVDVSRRDEMRAFAEEVRAPDVLVNNAGVGLEGGLLDTSLEDWDWLLSINLWGVIHGCHFFVPKMLERGRGHVVNVASAAGLMGSEDLVAYCTSKFAVVGLSESIRDELHRKGIGVTTICPGFINTPITQSSRRRGRLADAEAHAKLVDFYRWRDYGPEKVGAAIVDAVANHRDVVPVTPEAWAMYLMHRLAPRTTAKLARAVGSMMRK